MPGLRMASSASASVSASLQLGRGDLGLAAQERDRGADGDRVEQMQAGAQLAAKLDQRPSAGVGVVEAPKIEVLPHLSASYAGQQSLGWGGRAGARLIEQGLGVVVAVEELQRGDLLRRGTARQ